MLAWDPRECEASMQLQSVGYNRALALRNRELSQPLTGDVRADNHL